MAMKLQGAGFLAGGFYFDESEAGAREKDQTIWDAGSARGNEFQSQASGSLYSFDQPLFDYLFTHCRYSSQRASNSVT